MIKLGFSDMQTGVAKVQHETPSHLGHAVGSCTEWLKVTS